MSETHEHDSELAVEFLGWLRLREEAKQIPTWSDPKYGEILLDRFFFEKLDDKERVKKLQKQVDNMANDILALLWMIHKDDSSPALVGMLKKYDPVRSSVYNTYLEVARIKYADQLAELEEREI